MSSIQVQLITYQNDKEAVFAAIKGYLLAAQHGGHEIVFKIGDASPKRLFEDDEIASFAKEIDRKILYSFFDCNTGFGEGHNRLSRGCQSDYLVITNPDVLVTACFFDRMLDLFDQDVGIVEGRQTPIEHPKDYDANTFETDWASGACMMIPSALFTRLGGFDSATFWMYCEDVDLSWRVKAAGYKTLYQPNAPVYHPKRLSREARWVPTETERRLSAEVALLMAYKWGNKEELTRLLSLYSDSQDPFHREALRSFREKEKLGKLPEVINCNGFHPPFQSDGTYSAHRFLL